MNRKNIFRIIILLAIAAIFVVFFAYDLQQYLTLESMKQQQQQKWWVASIANKHVTSKRGNCIGLS